MVASEHRITEAGVRHRLWWLPANGFGNGLDDASWAAVLDVDGPSTARLVLSRMFEAGVPAYAAPLPRLESVGHPSGRRRGHHEPPVRVWVGATRYATAGDVLLEVIPRLILEHGAGVIL